MAFNPVSWCHADLCVPDIQEYLKEKQIILIPIGSPTRRTTSGSARCGLGEDRARVDLICYLESTQEVIGLPNHACGILIPKWSGKVSWKPKCNTFSVKPSRGIRLTPPTTTRRRNREQSPDGQLRAARGAATTTRPTLLAGPQPAGEVERSEQPLSFLCRAAPEYQVVEVDAHINDEPSMTEVFELIFSLVP